MAIANKLFTCLKEIFPEAVDSTLRSKTHSFCLWKWKMKAWLLLPLLHCHHTRALQAGGAQSAWAPRYLLGLSLLVALAMKTPWSSGSKALPEEQEGLQNWIPSSHPVITHISWRWVRQTVCFFHWIRNILPEWWETGVIVREGNSKSVNAVIICSCCFGPHLLKS